MGDRLTTIRPWLLAAPLLLSGACIPVLADAPLRDARNVLPEAFPVDATANGDADPGGVDWQGFFTDPALRGLIAAALDGNQELELRRQELVIARAEIGARQGELLPGVRVGASAGVDKIGEFTSQGAADHTSGLSNPLGDLSFGLRSTWELDVWGKLRAAVAAADARYLASAEARNFVATEVVAEVARTYYELVALDRRLEVVDRNLAVLEDALQVVRLQKAAARVTELAVQRFEAEVLRTRARRYALEPELARLEYRLNFLVGRAPRPIVRDAAALDTALPPTFFGGLPAKLLDNRADVRTAAKELEAARLDVESARARFLPSVDIDLVAGFRAFNPGHLLALPESLVLGVAGGLVAPLINRAGIEADYRTAGARQLQAVVRYERALLQAYTEVASEQVRLRALSTRFELDAKQVAVLREAIDVSNALFQSARADYMEVLLTRRDALEAELTLIETRAALRQAGVGLFQALGGGWRSASTAARPDPVAIAP